MEDLFIIVNINIMLLFILGKIYTYFKKDSRFYYLSLMYEDNKWVIHGLWPQNSKSDYPQYCKDVTFDPSLLDPIKSELNKCWYSYTGDNDAFWEHEWKKHGSCCFTELNEYQYFNTTLDLYKKATLDVISKYRKGEKALIPVDLNFNIIQ
tara:strand:+ start:27 stop:479 length:453 start_codon:yes stop_codon:yes gene_type:complete